MFKRKPKPPALLTVSATIKAARDKIEAALFEVAKVSSESAATKLLSDMLQQRRYINAVTAPAAHVLHSICQSG